MKWLALLLFLVPMTANGQDSTRKLGSVLAWPVTDRVYYPDNDGWVIRVEHPTRPYEAFIIWQGDTLQSVLIALERKCVALTPYIDKNGNPNLRGGFTSCTPFYYLWTQLNRHRIDEERRKTRAAAGVS